MTDDDLTQKLDALGYNSPRLFFFCKALLSASIADTAKGELAYWAQFDKSIADTAKPEPTRWQKAQMAFGGGESPVESIADTAGAKLTSEDVERQYQDGVHIGSGLPRATCPCGFCAKHRHGFNQGSEPHREMTANERWAHHPLIPLSAYSIAAHPAPSVADAAGVSRHLGKWTITKPTNDGSCGYTTYETYDAKEARDAGMRGWGVAQHFELMPVDLHKEVAKLTFLLRTTPEKFDAETLMQLDSVEYGLECARNMVADAAGASEDLRKFLDVAAGEGYVFDGVDAGDLYLRLFPDAFNAAIAKESGK